MEKASQLLGVVRSMIYIYADFLYLRVVHNLCILSYLKLLYMTRINEHLFVVLIAHVCLCAFCVCITTCVFVCVCVSARARTNNLMTTFKTEMFETILLSFYQLSKD